MKWALALLNIKTSTVNVLLILANWFRFEVVCHLNICRCTCFSATKFGASINWCHNVKPHVISGYVLTSTGINGCHNEKPHVILGFALTCAASIKGCHNEKPRVILGFVLTGASINWCHNIKPHFISGYVLTSTGINGCRNEKPIDIFGFDPTGAASINGCHYEKPHAILEFVLWLVAVLTGATLKNNIFFQDVFWLVCINRAPPGATSFHPAGCSIDHYGQGYSQLPQADAII